MTNVVSLFGTTSPASFDANDAVAGMVAAFAGSRRTPDDVFWLKENAEVLGILKTTGMMLSAETLSHYADFYAEIPLRMQFFPQYYRFLLSICLDLEDLGFPGTHGSEQAQILAQQGAAETELSDLQRAEARRLLARRDIMAGGSSASLEDRLHAFMARSTTFSMPNKKAAYELTHIVFYLSEYGARPLELSSDAISSLTYCGLQAFLDQNFDLLAEVCAALRFAGQTPSPIWEKAVLSAHRGFEVDIAPQTSAMDGYHEAPRCSDRLGP